MRLAKLAVSAMIVGPTDVHKRYGTLEVLRGIDLDRRARRGDLPARPFGLGQVHLPALRQPPRTHPGRPDLTVDDEFIGYRASGGRLHELRESEIAAQRAQIGMVFQHFNLFAHLTALENVIEAPLRVRELDRATAVARGHRPARPGRARPTSSTPTRRSCPVASSSASRSPARWRWSRS